MSLCEPEQAPPPGEMPARAAPRRAPAQASPPRPPAASASPRAPPRDAHPPGIPEFDRVMGWFCPIVWLVYTARLVAMGVPRADVLQHLALAAGMAVVGLLPRLPPRVYARWRNPYMFVLRVGAMWAPAWTSLPACDAVAGAPSALPPPLSWVLNIIAAGFATRVVGAFCCSLMSRLPARLSVAATVLGFAAVYRGDMCGCGLMRHPSTQAAVDAAHLVAASVNPLGSVAGATIPPRPADRCRVALAAAHAGAALAATALAAAADKRRGADAWAKPHDLAVERAARGLLAWLADGGAGTGAGAGAGGARARGARPGAAARLAGRAARAWLLALALWSCATILVTIVWPFRAAAWE